VTKLVHEGRQRAFDRMIAEAKHYGGVGLTGISFDMVNHGGNLEFITFGSMIHSTQGSESLQFTTSADAQELYCQLESEFQPLGFAFGNVAYSIGLGNSLTGMFTQMGRGEVAQYTRIFDTTRRLALRRLTDAALKLGANAVVGIETTITSLLGTQEMMMVGTASKHPALSAHANHPVTSDMTNEELWNMANLGYLPIRLVMGVSVYSLGLKGGILASLKSLGGGEVRGLTEILYEAREKALARIEQDAESFGADEVVGVKTRVYDLGGGLVEFLAIGTAVKKIPGAKTKSDTLIPQAIIQDRDTFVDSLYDLNMNVGRKDSAPRTQQGPLSIIFLLIVAFYLYIKIYRG
jgi:uncharacterized protein YbjQ (UPF0145 family)